MSDFPCDTIYDPPAPACDVALTVASTGKRTALKAILDTGSDATLVPLPHLQAIGARRAFEARLRSQWGERRVVFLYLVDVQIESLTLPGVYVIGDDLGDEVILGRDVLNRLRLTLDGPALVTRLLR